jgi:hypothetical protein
MARRNSMGERGSPCLTPLPCRTLEPGSPLRRTAEEAVYQRDEIQFLQFDEHSGNFILMQFPYDFLHIHESVMDTTFLYEGSLARRDQTVQLWPKSICKNLRYDFGETMGKTDWSEVCNSPRTTFFRHQDNVCLI